MGAVVFNLQISDIYQDGSQVLFKACPGTQGVPCKRTVHMGQSEDPRCPIHLILPPPMFQPEMEAPLPETLGATSRDMYLSAAELQPTENLPLEFSDVRTPHTPGGGSSRRLPALLRRVCSSVFGFYCFRSQFWFWFTVFRRGRRGPRVRISRHVQCQGLNPDFLLAGS